MVSKSTRNAHNKLNRKHCFRAIDDLTLEESSKLERSSHPKIPGKTEYDYALWCASKAYVGALVNLFKKHGIDTTYLSL